MIDRPIYDIKAWPTGSAYEALVRATASVSFGVGFVIRPSERHLSTLARSVLEELTSELISSQDVWSWPGSDLLSTSPPYAHSVYRCGANAVELLVSAAHSFGDWVNPHLPEDLHFLREDGSVVLGSVAQERFLWAELSGDEFATWSQGLPAGLLKQVVRRPG